MCPIKSFYGNFQAGVWAKASASTLIVGHSTFETDSYQPLQPQNFQHRSSRTTQSLQGHSYRVAAFIWPLWFRVSHGAPEPYFPSISQLDLLLVGISADLDSQRDRSSSPGALPPTTDTAANSSRSTQLHESSRSVPRSTTCISYESTDQLELWMAGSHDCLACEWLFRDASLASLSVILNACAASYRG